MALSIIKLTEFVFELGLCCILLVTLAYARRLDRLLNQVRRDREGMESLIGQIGSSIEAAITATDRLQGEASRSGVALEDACDAAAQATRRLDDLISQATLISTSRSVNIPQEQRIRETSARSEAPPTGQVAVAPGVSVCTIALRRGGKPQSRVEQDLARMLVDAS